MFWLSGLVVVLALVVAAGLTAYAFSLEGRWRRRVRSAQRQLEAIRAAEQLRLEQTRSDWLATEKRITLEGAERQLAAVDVEELDRFPGIGPKTVQTLRQAGLVNLKEIYLKQANLPEILRARAGLVQAAIAHKHHELQEQLRQHPEQLPHDLYSKYIAQQEQAKRELGHLGQRLQLLTELERDLKQLEQQYAPRSTLWAFVQRWCKRQPSALPADLLQHPLLDVEKQLLERERTALKGQPAGRFQIGGAVGTVFPGPPSEPSVRPLATGSTSARADKLGRSAAITTSAPPPSLFAPTVQSSASPSADKATVPVPPTPSFVSPRAQVDLVDLEIRILFLLAQADNRLSRAERDWIANYAQRQLARDQASQNRVRGLCAHYEQARPNADAILEELAQCAHEPRWQQAWPSWLELVNLSANAHSRKWELLKHLSDILQLPLPSSKTVSDSKAAGRDGVSELGSAAPTIGTEGGQLSRIPQAEMTDSEARRLLGLALAGALAPMDIRKQYETQCELFNPEKERIKGPEFVQLAERKRQEIREAAVFLLRQLGVADPERFLDEPAPPHSDVSRDNPDLDAIFQM